jgi:hypothetical protein
LADNYDSSSSLPQNHLAMTARSTPVRISAQRDQATLSKGQKTFNSLVKKIEASRHELAQWQLVVVSYQQKVASDFAPLLKKFQDLQTAMVHCLDQALDAKGLTKSERRVVQEVLCEVAEHLLAHSGDIELKEIYNKHSPQSLDAQEAAAAMDMKNAMQNMFGVDLGSDGEPASPQEFLDQLKEQMDKVHQRGVEEEEERRSRRKKPPKQLAREQAAKTEADQTSLSIREVYRKLASALHPDREPDTDERARKTALMQRVNQAYDKRNLLQLLELQLELEHIDAHTMAGLSEERLKHFNKILKDQLGELDQEIAHMEMPLRAQFQMPPYLRLMPSAVMPMLQRDIAELKRDIPKLKRELLVPQDLAAFKLWIKARRRESQAWQAQMRQMDEDCPF